MMWKGSSVIGIIEIDFLNCYFLCARDSDITKAKEEGPKDALRDLLTSFFTIKWQFYYELVPFAKKSSAALVCWKEKDPIRMCVLRSIGLIEVHLKSRLLIYTHNLWPSKNYLLKVIVLKYLIDFTSLKHWNVA